MKTTTILVTGCGGSAAFNFISSLKLASKNITVIGIDANKYHLALSNADKKYLIPPNLTNQKYILLLNQIIKKNSVDLVHPQPDIEVHRIGSIRSQLLAKTFLPKDETIEICQNKMRLVVILNNTRLSSAETYLVTNKASLKIAISKIQQKSEKCWIRAIRGAGSRAALPVKTREQAESWIEYWHANKGIGYGDFMVSEFLPGKEYAFQSVWDNGTLLVSQARERIEYVFGNLTPSGQSSSPAVAKTVSNTQVNKLATAAILAVDAKATGVFCVDLKENSNGQPCVTEINVGRFFTTSNFFAEAGCNMPDYYIKLALGQSPTQYKKYNNLKPNIYWVRLMDMGSKLVTNNQWDIDESLC